MMSLPPLAWERTCSFPKIIERCPCAISLKFLALLVAFVLVAVDPAMAAGLNDTGITTYGNDSAIGFASEPAGHPGQDASYGRDAAAKAGILVKVGGGNAGFDFSKIGTTGQTLPDDAVTWSCVRDNVTGLVWEMKTDDGGLHGKDWTYSWYNSTGVNDGGDPGVPSYGSCGGSVAAGCDTEKFAAAVNLVGLCGASDWRLPSRKELLTIVDNSRFNPAIDTKYFPNTRSSTFWSASPDANYFIEAWDVSFVNGVSSYGQQKLWGLSVRLVRGGQ